MPAVIKIFPNEMQVAAAAADLFLARAQQSVQTQGIFRVSLAGGTTPRKIYTLLKSSPYIETIPWDRTHIFWGDERCVPPSHERSNQQMAREAFLDMVPIPPENIHTVATNEAPEIAAVHYETDILNHFKNSLPRFDLILLGLGADGHTASLFPNSPALLENHALVQAVFPSSQPEPRITITFPLINAAKAILFIVTGESKSRVIKEIVKGPKKEKPFPAQLVQPSQGDITWLLDALAAKTIEAS